MKCQTNKRKKGRQVKTILQPSSLKFYLPTSAYISLTRIYCVSTRKETIGSMRENLVRKLICRIMKTEGFFNSSRTWDVGEMAQSKSSSLKATEAGSVGSSLRPKAFVLLDECKGRRKWSGDTQMQEEKSIPVQKRERIQMSPFPFPFSQLDVVDSFWVMVFHSLPVHVAIVPGNVLKFRKHASAASSTDTQINHLISCTEGWKM